jgi:hypothetical protein
MMSNHTDPTTWAQITRMRKSLESNPEACEGLHPDTHSILLATDVWQAVTERTSAARRGEAYFDLGGIAVIRRDTLPSGHGLMLNRSGDIVGLICPDKAKDKLQ